MIHEELIQEFAEGVKFQHLAIWNCMYTHEGGYCASFVIGTLKSEKYVAEIIKEKFYYFNYQIPVFENKNGQVLFLVAENKCYGKEITRQENIAILYKLIPELQKYEGKILV